MKVLHCANGGGYALLDDADYNAWKGYRWGQESGYICADFRMKGKKIRRYYLHRLIARPERGLVVHHKNHCRWDNQRENLQCLTVEEHKRLHPDGRGIGARKLAGLYRVMLWDEEQEILATLRFVEAKNAA